MRSNKRTTRQFRLAIATSVAMAMTTLPGMAGGMAKEQTASSTCDQQFLAKARILERQAASLLHMQTLALLEAYGDGSGSPAELKEAIDNQKTRIRFAVEALMRSRTAPQDWYMRVSDIAKTYEAMSEVAARTADLLEAGDTDSANALYRTEAIGLYDDIMRASYALTSNIGESVSIGTEREDVAN